MNTLNKEYIPRLELVRQWDNAVLSKWNKTEVFNLQSKRDCERLQSITKAGFDLIIDMPWEVLDVSTLEFI